MTCAFNEELKKTLHSVQASIPSEFIVINSVVGSIQNLVVALEESRQQVETLTREREWAAGEGMVNIQDAMPGTTAGKLLSANAILRRERDAAIAAKEKAERERDELVKIGINIGNSIPIIWGMDDGFSEHDAEAIISWIKQSKEFDRMYMDEQKERDALQARVRELESLLVKTSERIDELLKRPGGSRFTEATTILMRELLMWKSDIDAALKAAAEGEK